MKKASWIRALGMVCALAVIAVGCGSGEESVTNARQEQFEPIKQQWAALDAKRQEVADLKARIADAAGNAAAEAEEVAGASVEDLEAELRQAKKEVESMSEDFMGALITFLNSANLVEGEAPDASTLEAIRLKSSEDLVIAQEYIDQGGDYRRAIDIIDTSLVLDPENPDLLDAKARAEVDQYMTEERFAQVVAGMSQDEVRSRLGTANPSNVREYPEDNVEAWFYRREDKGAAGVYFQRKNGVLKVYKLDFNAVKPEEDE